MRIRWHREVNDQVRLTATAGCVALLACATGCGFCRPDVEPDVAALGRLAPDFSLADTDGTQRSLSALSAQGPVVLHFFCDT